MRADGHMCVQSPEEVGKRVKLLILDVDGVMTDGGLYYDAEGRVSKRYNVQDGLGIKIAQAHGLEVAVATLVSPYLYMPLMDEIRGRLSLERSQIAYLGDDWVDAGVMQAVGLPMAVANAQPEILSLALWTTRLSGGQGAVREAIMFLLRCRGEYAAAWEKWSR